MKASTAAWPRTVGEYRIVAPLGSGGMGDVYCGISPTGDRVAVKVIRPHLVTGSTVRERFAAEVESLKIVYGTRVARLEDADPYGDPAWLAVEYIPGLTVRQFVHNRGPVPAGEAAMVGAMLADGLAKVHQGGLLHRDLKPQNVILGPSGPVLIDFGLAALAEREHELTITGSPVGTPAYMAPEQARAEKDLKPTVDVYGLAATLVYALTGHLLYAEPNWYTLLKRIADPDDRPDLSGVPAVFASLIGAMLAHDPSARPDIAAVRARLLTVATSGGVTIEQARIGVVDATFDPSAVVEIPPEVADPLVDPGDLVDEIDQLDDTDDTTDTDGESREAEDDPPPAVVDPDSGSVTPVDLSRLVETLRRQYARRNIL